MNAVVKSLTAIRLKAFVPSLCCSRGMRKWDLPPDYSNVIMPPAECRLLPVLEKAPVIPAGGKAFKYERRFSDLRGPELIHNTFMYNQYGIMALAGGNIKSEHMTLMKDIVNKFLNQDKMFAVWRIDPPWKSICRRGQGKRMGGGKASISYYVTPVKAGRVLLEVGGYIEFEEVLPWLTTAASKLPFAAFAIDSKGLETLREEAQQKAANNINPVSYKRAIELNLVNSRAPHMSNEYDQIWFGKYE